MGNSIMANNYTQFSLSFQVTPEACEWIKTILTKAVEASGDDTDDKELLTVFPNWEFFQCIGFDWSINANGRGNESSHMLWIRDNGESGDVNSVADFIQSYLKKFDNKGKVGFQWAATCSKQRVGEFGGGACLVTAKKLKWMNTAKWIQTALSK